LATAAGSDTTNGPFSIVTAVDAAYGAGPMKPGGESDKFGNDYEKSWTIDSVLQVIDGRALELLPEPVVGGRGVEFIKVKVGGVREFHSAKIQKTGNYWSVPDLVQPKPARSIVGDLFEKMATDPKAEGCFVSEVGANPLQVICEDARLAASDADFLARLSASRAGDFQTYILPYFKDIAEARNRLARLHVTSYYQRDLDERIERDIGLLLRRSNHAQLVPGDVRRFLGETVLDFLGKTLTKADLLARLSAEGYELADYARNPTILDSVKARNGSYRASATKFLINKGMIQRKEAMDAFLQLQTGSVKFGAFVGTAGLGKSCAIAELLDYLEGGGLPCLVLRLDMPIKALTPQTLGPELGLPISPVDLLATIAEGRRCVLILDQLDALSIVSGRSTHLWPLVDQLLAEVARYPSMCVWLGCRAFDLDNDPAILKMMKDHGVQKVQLQLLDVAEVQRQVALAKYDEKLLTTDQLEVLRTPMHLSIYIEGDPDPAKPFKTVIDLYDRYWVTKQNHIKASHGGSVQWTAVIDLVCDDLTALQSLSAPVAKIQDSPLWDDARKMASANVLLIDDKVCRFFHEGFFDYAFARRFVHKGKKLSEFLISSGEQDLFRRAQVRQVLTYLRARDRARYLIELESLLKATGIRPHILQLVYQWLGGLKDPTREELELLALQK
jgi:hypothetical protein